MVIYLDSADLSEMHRWHDKIGGFTTNPTLCRKAGVTDYLEFAKEVTSRFPEKQISLEVIADDQFSMETQARILADLGPNVVVKIPITNTRGEYTRQVMQNLREDNIKINVTAVMTLEQVKVASVYSPEIISVFCGRIADTGVDPVPLLIHIGHFLDERQSRPKILWASARQIFDVVDAKLWCDIITLSPELLAKMDMFGKDLSQFSLETVQQFFNDAQKAGYIL